MSNDLMKFVINVDADNNFRQLVIQLKRFRKGTDRQRDKSQKKIFADTPTPKMGTVNPCYGNATVILVKICEIQ